MTAYKIIVWPISSELRKILSGVKRQSYFPDNQSGASDEIPEVAEITG